jgi:hypothetical protein
MVARLHIVNKAVKVRAFGWRLTFFPLGNKLSGFRFWPVNMAAG